MTIGSGSTDVDMGEQAMLEVFEGPLCCNTGVCGSSPDQALVDFTADVDWASGRGALVRRANLAQDPQVFAESPVAREFVRRAGIDGLPLLVSDGVTVMAGRYPTRTELARFTGLEAPAAVDPSAPSADSACCCGAADAASAAGRTADAASPSSTTDCCGTDAAGSSCCCGPEPVSIEPRPEVVSR